MSATDWSRLALTAALSTVLAACVSIHERLDTRGVDAGLTPARVLSQPETTRGTRVLWGGVVVATKNVAQATEIEVLAYPLDERSGEPKTAQAPRERFILVHPGYLETVDYATGRLLTVVGSVEGTREGTVGEARYVYPVVRASGLHLWPKETYRSTDPRIHFGIGISIVR